MSADEHEAGGTDPRDVASALARALPGLHRAMERRLARDFGHPKPPENQLAVLRLVRARDGITVREAAEALLMKPNNLSALVSQMVNAGMLRKEQDPDDRRIVHLHVAEESLGHLNAVDTFFRDYVTRALEALGAEERADIRRALPALEELARHIDPAAD
ncbi:MarR family winged helix-turn-helix transcriptional regulator [Actinocorallia populi]|uniref:MarR family winged helix-turn-helix transcriptional regulator n=1 Tax=Actinocorallia populi TaxID=2079200 RepID=UPI000D08DD72|nr:MarR family winged helix-turn-helix transcriptional regulator [Actinocorallia populi]